MQKEDKQKEVEIEFEPTIGTIGGINIDRRAPIDVTPITGVCVDIPTIIKEAKAAKLEERIKKSAHALMNENIREYLTRGSFEIPRYEFEGLPIYPSSEIPPREMHLYDLESGQKTIVSVPDDKPIDIDISIKDGKLTKVEVDE
jgi:hypothetical protein